MVENDQSSKKDGTKEDFNVQKVVVAVNKSHRALITFTQGGVDFICQFVEEKVKEIDHRGTDRYDGNIVEGALERVNLDRGKELS